MHVPREDETLPESRTSLGERIDARITVCVDGDHDPDKVVNACIAKMGTATIQSLNDSNLTIYKPFKEQLGCFRHYARCLGWLVDQSKEGDIVAVLPDDLIYIDGVDIQKSIQQALNPDLVGYCAIYTPKELGRRNRWKFGGWQPVSGGWDSSYGGGYFFRREVAEKVLGHPFFIDHRDNYEKNQQIDHCIPEVIHRLGLKQLFHVPSLSKHIGLTSTIGHVHTEAEEPWGWK